MLKLITLCLICALALSFSPSSVQARTTLSFDAGWLFYKGDSTGAENPSFNDSSWRKLDVPHDWSIEGPFDKDSPTRGSGGFLPSGVGWYRKHFTFPTASKNKRVFIEFDGVMANSDVWINGFHLGKRPYGYVSFRYELTEHLNLAGDNVVAVRADTSAQPASRWYSGAGIYRHTRLVTTEPVHFEHWATFITTPQVETNSARVLVRTTVINQSTVAQNAALEITLIDANGRAVKAPVTSAQHIAPGKSVDFKQEIVVKNPLIWDKDHPSLYKAITRVRADKSIVDEETTTFGIREFHFDADTGFWLNGRNFKLKGVCLHHDGSAFGAAVPLRVWERRLEILRALGVNAIRTAHNPPSPEFLDLCDRMGFLVMDEMFDAWTVAKNPYDYHLYFKKWSLIDTRDTVRRDRNHPSIILYSAGNEIHDTPKPEIAKPILSSLVKVFHENDDSRPVTQGLFRPNVSKDYDNGLADLLDVVGQNYRENEILAAHKQKPTRKIVGTENTHERSAWLPMRDNREYAGQFIWAGIDYLGESPAWPNMSYNFGLLDRTGTVRPIGYQRASWWSDKPMVYIARRVAPTPLAPTDPGYSPIPDRRPQVLFSDWTPRNLSVHEENVEVYSNCDEVELFLNGLSLGTQTRPADDAPRIWKVQYAPGTLLAVGRNNEVVGGALLGPQASPPAPSRHTNFSAPSPRSQPSWPAFSKNVVRRGFALLGPQASPPAPSRHTNFSALSPRSQQSWPAFSENVVHRGFALLGPQASPPAPSRHTNFSALSPRSQQSWPAFSENVVHRGFALLGPQASPPAPSPDTDLSAPSPRSQPSSAANQNKSRQVATYELRTAGPPAKILLTPDRHSLSPSFDDVIYVTATVVDANGVLIPTASDLITFNVTGPGVIAAVDSGNNTSHEPFQASERKAYQGRCFAMIKASALKGRITLTASAPGLKGSSVSIVLRK